MANDKNLKPFKKGQTGNPKGNWKGTVHISTMLNRLLDGTITIEEVEEKVSKREAIWLQVLSDALDKKMLATDRHRAVSMIFDRTDGKPTQPMNVSLPDKEPVSFAGLTTDEKLQLLSLLEKTTGANED